MNQSVIIKNYDIHTELEMAAVRDHVEIRAKSGNDEVLFSVKTSSAREIARLLNLIATIAEAEGNHDAKK